MQTFGIALRRGRMFDAAELRRGDRVAVINESAAKLWPAGTEPVGALVRLPVLQNPPPRTLADTQRAPDVTIIGVIADTRNAGLRSQPMPAVVMPYTIIAPLGRPLAIRTSGDPNLALNPIRAELRAMDPEQPLGRPITMSEILGQDVVQPRFTMALFTAFAALGLALAAAGIYSVLSFHVMRRRHELGVRMALGAPRRHVLGLMLAMGGRLVVIGFVVGVAASIVSSRLLRSQLFGVQPARSTLVCRRGLRPRPRDACRLLPPCPPRCRCRSHHCSQAGVNGSWKLGVWRKETENNAVRGSARRSPSHSCLLSHPTSLARGALFHS